MTTKEIVVVGYHRSGNIWLSRLLAEALDAPVVTYQFAPAWGPSFAETSGGASEWRIVQIHALPDVGDYFWLLDWRIDLRHQGNRKVVHIVRDPRDIAASMEHYYRLKTLDEAVDIMLRFQNGIPPWHEYVKSWLATGVPTVRYKDLGKTEPGCLLSLFGLEPVKPLDEVIANQSFAVKRRHIEEHGDEYAYGRDIQLHHMNKGVAGAGVARFTQDLADRVRPLWGPLMAQLGYMEDA